MGLGSPFAAEVCAAAGVDWILVDLEHGAGGETSVGPAVLAAAAYGVPTVVRVETGDRIRAGRVLDQNAAGVMVPRVESAKDAAEAVQHLRYAPQGVRGSATYNRACAWGLDASPLSAEGQDALGVIQIESLGALAEVEEIAALDGVDVLFVGPLDLSTALGAPRDFNHPDYQAALDRVLDACRFHGKAAGILAPDGAKSRDYLQAGFRFVGIGSDSTVLSAALSSALDTARS